MKWNIYTPPPLLYAMDEMFAIRCPPPPLDCANVINGMDHPLCVCEKYTDSYAIIEDPLT